MIIKQKCEGFISLAVGKTIDNPRYKTEFKNLIVDQGLNNAASTEINNLVSRCKVGSSSDIPTTSDTSLGQPVGFSIPVATSFYSHSSGIPVWYTYGRFTYTFPVGAVTGDLREIGFFDSSGNMFSHALIKDGAGNPTTVTVLADEQLFVTYEVRKYPVETDQTGTFVLTINGVDTSFTYTARPALINTTTPSNYWYGSHQLGVDTNIVAYESQTLGPVTGTPTGTAVAGSGTIDTYVAGSFKSTLNCIFDPSAANFTNGIGSMMLCNGFQVSFDPAIPKNSDRRLILPLSTIYSRKE